MKFLFVENRYKTYFWEALAQHLVSAGHEVAWLVQNHAFMPAMGRVHVLPYPHRADFRPPDESPDIAFIRSSDRSINFLGGNDRHYAYYQGLIDACLDAEQPDVVLGEPTLFHELMAAAWCRRNRVRYLHPSMPGYPSGRFCIYDGDTKVPLGHSNDVPSDADCIALAQAIRGRSAIPDYMKPPLLVQGPRVHPVHRSWKDVRNIFFAYVSGERYNTTPPWRRLWRPIGLAMRSRAWERLAAERASRRIERPVVLYPMQMQPEANLDVWGNPHRDQTALIAQIADILPHGWNLLVKANPKTKYEMSGELIDVVRARANVIPLPIRMPMGDVLPTARLVVTVTGTIAIETVLSGIPLAQLGPGVTEGLPGCETIASVDALPSLLDCIASGRFRTATEPDCIALVKKLYETSFPGRVSDPATLPDVTQEANVAQVVAELLKVVCP